MIAEYINRKKEPHFLISKTTKNGKARYYVIKDKAKYPASDLLIEVPKGFEFYEHPEDGAVVLRKILQSTILQHEVDVINGVMKNHLTAKDYIIDKTENSIDVYLANLNIESFAAFPELAGRLHEVQLYTQKLRFEKANNNKYMAQRFCYLGRYDRWITMETSNDLNYLAEKYCFHIDKESLLEFWIEGEEDW